MELPKDPVMRMSVVNTLLRDQYKSPQALCEDRELDWEALCAGLEAVGFVYQPSCNQFR